MNSFSNMTSDSTDDIMVILENLHNAVEEVYKDRCDTDKVDVYISKVTRTYKANENMRDEINNSPYGEKIVSLLGELPDIFREKGVYCPSTLIRMSSDLAQTNDLLPLPELGGFW